MARSSSVTKHLYYCMVTNLYDDQFVNYLKIKYQQLMQANFSNIE